MSPPARNRTAVELIEYTIRDAEYMASLVIAFLEGLGMLPPRGQRRPNPVGLPAEFLLELAAVLRIAAWERAGLRDSLCRGLPPAEEALDDLFRRYVPVAGLEQPERRSSTLAMDVFKISLSRLAWEARGALRTDVVLDRPADDLLLESMADFLWEHRRACRGVE
jgi:hypothetical protein